MTICNIYGQTLVPGGGLEVGALPMQLVRDKYSCQMGLRAGIKNRLSYWEISGDRTDLSAVDNAPVSLVHRN